MKKFYLLLSFVLLGITAHAVPAHFNNFDRTNYRDAFIFVERGIEFAIFPDGQFDFFFNPTGNFNRIPPHRNYSFNSGYNYGPYVQYDDYGAVIQIENVPIYYDYYGRIIQAGRVNIRYNAFGMVNRIGNMFLHYNHYDQFTHTSGFINSRNTRYVYRPWHDYYVRPHNYVVVHNQPYRIYYTPNRMKFNHYRRYYNDHYSSGSFQQYYYRPGDRVTTYHRGRRDESPREVDRASIPSRNTVTTSQERRIYRQPDTPASSSPQGVQRSNSTSARERSSVRPEQTPPVRSSRVENVPQSRPAEVPAAAATRRTAPVSTARPEREAQVQSPRTETPSEVNSATPVRSPDPVSSRGTRSSRGGQ
ncbi:hypothetical protein [Salinimicrobium oceani]|uniref:WG containing repeat-containing protein n=1 Tax=Salinimicrobium oceani TaxID=2722702 RepID=A0ABX1D473_9FLAO|nr:hypothetical protein [Salinimicrobium oceani]NJW54137.1 hypothetical protein [Salinimicrobium oceani]